MDLAEKTLEAFEPLRNDRLILLWGRLGNNPKTGVEDRQGDNTSTMDRIRVPFARSFILERQSCNLTL